MNSHKYTINVFLDIDSAIAPTWNFDDTRIIYFSNKSGTYQLYSILSNGTDKIQLTNYKNPQTEFIKKDIQYFNETSKSRVTGELINNSPFGFDKVDIIAIVRDLDGRILGVNYTNIDDFLPSSNRYFSVFWNNILAKNKNKVQIEIEPNVNVFEAGKFMDLYGSGQILEY